MSKWGKHIAAIAVFLVLTVIYFSPAVFEGKVVSENIKIGIVAARFNEFITSKLLSGAIDGLERLSLIHI